MKIYTKAGDRGTTSLFGGTEVLKNSAYLDAYGTVDELNCLIGLIRSVQTHKPTDQALAKIQNTLFNLGSHLACDKTSLVHKLPRLTDTFVTFMESEIDKMNKDLTPLKQFILPGGVLEASFAHQARAVCRRAERALVHLAQEKNELSRLSLALKHLNRLSDYLFVLARFFNHMKKQPETVWDKTTE